MKRFLTCVLALVMVLGLAAGGTPARAATGGKLIALTFDDGPGPYTGRLLDGLKERGVKVTFFMVGTNVKRYPELVSRAYQEGHQIANHSYDHANLVNLSDSGVADQIASTNALLDLACGTGTSYMVRPPYGSTNSRVRADIAAPLILWSVDPLDWKDRNASTVKSRVVKGAADGAIILLHDIHSTSVDGALAAIDELQEDGYEFVTVKELYRRRGVAMENGTTYGRCKPNGTDLGPVTPPVLTSRSVDGKLEITITAQAGASVYYSLSDAALNGASTLYTGPFTVTPPCTVWAAAAFDMNGSRSETVEQRFTQPVAKAPVIQVSDGVLTLENQTPGAEMYYTLDGTAATVNSARYTGPVSVAPGTVISACAAGGEYLVSPASRAAYSDRGQLFRDVFPGDWYYKAVDQAAAEGFMSGKGGERFAPNDALSRAQLVTLLYRYSGEKVTQVERDSCPFRDIKPDGFCRDAVCWAFARGLVKGQGDDIFAPDGQISRQEMCVILAKFLGYRGLELPEGAGALEQFADADAVASWARKSVQAVVACGLMKGDATGSFSPAAGATRAQGAAILVRVEDVEDALSTIRDELPEDSSQEEGAPSPEAAEVGSGAALF